jgi:hypothetical protein
MSTFWCGVNTILPPVLPMRRGFDTRAANELVMLAVGAGATAITDAAMVSDDGGRCLGNTTQIMYE